LRGVTEGTKPINNKMEGTRPPAGASPTQPYKCSQYFKIKVKIKRFYGKALNSAKYLSLDRISRMITGFFGESAGNIARNGTLLDPR
jgi:hypothetical protein